MSHNAAILSPLPAKLDYSLTGLSAAQAIEKGLAEADWYQCPVPRETMRKLLERRDGPAIRDTVLWFALILSSGFATYALWGTWWVIFPYLIYSVLYASTSDSRWHECGHGTAFKTDWMNNALYEIASFMVMRESTVWRWSHTRHHSDTIIVGRDPEIAVPRPPDVKAIVMSFFNLRKLSEVFPADRAALVRPHVSRRKNIHPGDGVSQGISARAHLRRHLPRSHWACNLYTQFLSSCSWWVSRTSSAPGCWSSTVSPNMLVWLRMFSITVSIAGRCI